MNGKIASLSRESLRLNAIAPYFTMFPLDFPLSILSKASPKDRVLDPFCGRGTTNFAARVLGLDSLGVDSSPVAVAITAAKLVAPREEEVIKEAKEILANLSLRSIAIPEGEFWQLAYHPEVLKALSLFREVFSNEPLTPARIALRGILLGALHGPLGKTPSYLSNQMPRSYAPKPGYAVRFWRSRGLHPPKVDVLAIIAKRSKRYYQARIPPLGRVLLGDSRIPETFAQEDKKFQWVITSPPYYGLKTYLPDQWLRLWLLGGPDAVSYKKQGQITHTSPEAYIRDLALVWSNVTRVAYPGAIMAIRFGSIPSHKQDSLSILLDSFAHTSWRLLEVRTVPPPRRRQAQTFLTKGTPSFEEWDVFMVLSE